MQHVCFLLVRNHECQSQSAQEPAGNICVNPIYAPHFLPSTGLSPQKCSKSSSPSKTRWWQLKYFIHVHPYLGEDEPNLTHIFQMGWFNHQLETPEKNTKNTLTTSMDGKVHTEMIDTTDLDDFMNTFMQPPKTGETVGKNTQTPVKRWVISVILSSPRRRFFFVMFCAWWNVVDVIEQFVVLFFLGGVKGVETFKMQRMGETFESSSHLIMLKWILKAY